MKILVLTLNAWNNTNSTGNTITNLFSELSDNDEVANIFCRNESIDNTICKKYYKITENNILHNLFTPKKCGVSISSHEYSINSDSRLLGKNKSGDFLRRHRFTSLLLLRELIWTFPVWKNYKLNSFLNDFVPDVIYMHGHNNLYMHRLLDYCTKVTGAKVVLYWGDDMYGRKYYSPLGYIYETLLRKQFRKSINKASLLFGGSLKLCEEYSQVFGKQFTPFFKECKQFSVVDNKSIGNPISIVYAGNLLFGREDIILELSKKLRNINKKDLKYKFQLIVYSNTNPKEENLKFLDDKNNCIYMGCQPYASVIEAMNRADFALFIESFNKNSIKSTRLSFSTKIIDCLQSSAAILAIGPKEIASMEYITENNIGFVITNASEIEDKLHYLAKHSNIIPELNNRKYAFALKFHTNTSKKALQLIKDL